MTEFCPCDPSQPHTRGQWHQPASAHQPPPPGSAANGERITQGQSHGAIQRHAAVDADGGNLRGMTAPRLLDAQAIADQLGLTLRTIHNYHQAAVRNRKAGKPKPGDFPEPDDTFGRSPVWKASTIRRWLNHRPGQGAGGGRPRKEPTDG